MRTATLRLSLLALASFATACQAEPTRASNVSFVDRVAAIMPVLACLDAAPIDGGWRGHECLAEAGMDESDLRAQPSQLPEPAHILPLAVVFGQGEGAQFGPEVQARALRYGRCVEAAAMAVEPSAGRSEAAFYAAQGAIKARCRALLPDDAAMIRGEPVPQSESATYLLATNIGNLALTYHARMKGWFPKALEPCVRYLDGRPPSPGCKGKPPLVAPAPPPQVRP